MRSPAFKPAAAKMACPRAFRAVSRVPRRRSRVHVQHGLLLLIAMIVVYIMLGILYESFIHPLTILSGLPSAAVGALLTLYLFGHPLTLYAFVGMIMLIGIVKKNAIMMIDFALNVQRSGTASAPRRPSTRRR